jgi:hypothetical protein
MDLSEILTVDEKLFIECILNKVSEKIKVDVQDMLDIFNLKCNEPISNLLGDKNEYDICLCRAKTDGIKQCSRKQKKEGFCMTHYKMYMKNELEDIIEFIDEDFKIRLKKLRERRKIPKLINTKLIIIQGKEYLIDPYTNEVYDFDNYKFIGKMDLMENLKFKLTRTELTKYMMNKSQINKIKSPENITDG